MFRHIPFLSKTCSPGSMYLTAGCGAGSVLHAAQSIKEKTSTLQVQKLTPAAGLPPLDVSGLILNHWHVNLGPVTLYMY
jgi:hypothetical protein